MKHIIGEEPEDRGYDYYPSNKAVTIMTAQRASNIDGFGDEGAGYDYEFFVAELESLGWHFTNEDD